MRIRQRLLVCVALIGLGAGAVHAEEPEVVKPGLVAHYFKDHDNWKGIWPDSTSVPNGRPSDWTFTKYIFSRVEPLINHRFVRKGWFSIRWKGYFDPKAPVAFPVSGKINLNPNNRPDSEFTLVLQNGRKVTRDDLTKSYGGYSGRATSVHVKPKGNGNQTSLTVAGSPYQLANAKAYDIAGELKVKLFNDHVTRSGKAMGKWWLEIEAETAAISCNGEAVGGGAGGPDGEGQGTTHTYTFEIFADDGCRLWIGGQELIDDWRACWEETPGAHRRTRGVQLANGRHEIVVEYFQGQSLMADDDQDPIVLKWSCPARGIRDQVIPAGHFLHGAIHMKSWKR